MLLIVLLAACARATQPEPTPQPSATPQTAQDLPSTRPLVLTLWHSWSGRSAQALDLLARRYEQSHPGIRINLQARPAVTLIRDYGANVADGSAPQLLLVLSRYVGELAERRQILPLDEQVDARLADLLPAALDGARIAGRLHGVPLSYDSLVLFYDRRKIAESPVTLEQLLTSAPPAASPDQAAPQNWSLAYHLAAPATLPYLWAFEGAIFDADGDVSVDSERRPGTLRWIEWMKNLRADTRAFATEDFGAVDAMIQANRVAAAVDWTYRLPAYEQLWGPDAVGVAALPRTDGQSPLPSTLVLADVVCINVVTTAQQRTAATDFLIFLARAQAQELLWTRGGLFPASQSARVDGAAAAIMAASADGVPFPNTAADSRAWPVLDEMVRSALAGSATPTEALETAATALRAVSQQP